MALSFWQCAACKRRFTREQIEVSSCPCGSDRFLSVEDLEAGDRAIERLVRQAKAKKKAKPN